MTLSSPLYQLSRWGMWLMLGLAAFSVWRLSLHPTATLYCLFFAACTATLGLMVIRKLSCPYRHTGSVEVPDNTDHTAETEDADQA